mmetsp:Transcript_75448/g.200389  ORF Transcript_75448/g.200389 Transcript_75448/m.200389 type:complete len:208 (-) Transcript_75448:548-1171(-)
MVAHLAPLVAAPSEEVALQVQSHAVRLTASDVLHAAFLQRHDADRSAAPPQVRPRAAAAATAASAIDQRAAIILQRNVAADCSIRGITGPTLWRATSAKRPCRWQADAKLPLDVGAEREDGASSHLLQLSGDAILRHLQCSPPWGPSSCRDAFIRRTRCNTAWNHQPLSHKVQHVVVSPPGPEGPSGPHASLARPQQQPQLALFSCR